MTLVIMLIDFIQNRFISENKQFTTDHVRATIGQTSLIP